MAPPSTDAPQGFNLSRAYKVVSYLETNGYHSPQFTPDSLLTFAGQLPLSGGSVSTVPEDLAPTYARLIHEAQRSAYWTGLRSLLGSEASQALNRNASRFRPQRPSHNQLRSFWTRGDVRRAVEDFLRQRGNERYADLYEAVLTVDRQPQTPAESMSQREVFLRAVRDRLQQRDPLQLRRGGDFDFSGPLSQLDVALEEFRLALFEYFQTQGGRLMKVDGEVRLNARSRSPLDQIMLKYPRTLAHSDPQHPRTGTYQGEPRRIHPTNTARHYSPPPEDRGHFAILRELESQLDFQSPPPGAPLTPAEIPFNVAWGAYSLGIGRTMNFAGYPVVAMGRSQRLGDTRTDVMGRHRLLTTGGNVQRLGQTVYDAEGHPFREPIPINRLGALGVSPLHPYHGVETLIGRNVVFVGTPGQGLDQLLRSSFLDRIRDGAVLVFPQKLLMDPHEPGPPPQLLSEWVTDRLDRQGRADLVPRAVHVRALNFARDLAGQGIHVRLTADAWEDVNAARLVAHYLTGSNGDKVFTNPHRTVEAGTNPRAADLLGALKNGDGVYEGYERGRAHVDIALRRSEATTSDVRHDYGVRLERFERYLLGQARAFGIVGPNEALPHGGLEDLRACTNCSPRLFPMTQQLFRLEGRGFLRALSDFPSHVADLANSRNFQYGYLTAVGEALVGIGKIADMREVFPQYGLTAQGVTSADRFLAFFEHPQRAALGGRAPRELVAVPQIAAIEDSLVPNLRTDPYGYPLQALLATAERFETLARHTRLYLGDVANHRRGIDRTPEGLRTRSRQVVEEIVDTIDEVIHTHESAPTMIATTELHRVRDRSLANLKAMRTSLIDLLRQLDETEVMNPEKTRQALEGIIGFSETAEALFHPETPHPERRGIHQALMMQAADFSRQDVNVWVDGLIPGTSLGGPLHYRMSDPVDALMLGQHMTTLATTRRQALQPERKIWREGLGIMTEHLRPEDPQLRHLLAALEGVRQNGAVGNALTEVAALDQRLIAADQPLSTMTTGLLLVRQSHLLQPGVEIAAMPLEEFAEGPGRFEDREVLGLRTLESVANQAVSLRTLERPGGEPPHRDRGRGRRGPGRRG